MENKRLFVQRVNEALLECGDGRYGYLSEQPLTYIRTECGGEFVTNGQSRVCVEGDSLTAILEDIQPLF